MVTAGPPPDRDPRRSKGGSALLPSAGRQPLGWPALFVSLGVHSAVIAAAALVLNHGQGNAGDDGMDMANAQEASATVFPAIPKPPSESVHVSARATKTFLPARSPKLLAATHDAEINLPTWEMKPSKPILAPALVPLSQAQTAKPLPSTAAVTKGTAERTMRNASGSGAGGGRGDSVRAAPPPQIVSSYAPAYPSSARRAGIEGTATVRVAVSLKGRVVECSIFRSAGDDALDAAALKAVRGWRFTPAQADATEVLVRVTFRLG